MKQWRPYPGAVICGPLDEHMPDPVKAYTAWLAQRTGLWFWAWDSYWDHWAEREEWVRQLKAELGIK